MKTEWNEEEIRAAICAAQYANYTADDVIAELTKPAIHPNVPVMYDIMRGDLHEDVVGYYSATVRISATNVRALVPIEAAVDKAYEILRQHSHSTPIIIGNFRDRFEEWRDHYLATGETE